MERNSSLQTKCSSNGMFSQEYSKVSFCNTCAALSSNRLFIIKAFLNVASASRSTLPLPQWLMQRMGVGPILYVCVCVTINSMAKLTLTHTQTLAHTLHVNRALLQMN